MDGFWCGLSIDHLSHCYLTNAFFIVVVIPSDAAVFLSIVFCIFFTIQQTIFDSMRMYVTLILTYKSKVLNCNLILSVSFIHSRNGFWWLPFAKNRNPHRHSNRFHYFSIVFASFLLLFKLLHLIVYLGCFCAAFKLALSNSHIMTICYYCFRFLFTALNVQQCMLLFVMEIKCETRKLQVFVESETKARRRKQTEKERTIA